MSILHEPLTVRRDKHDDSNRKTSVSIHNSTVYQDVVCVINGLEREQDILYHMEKYRRIAACVNACQGLTTEALEDNVIDRSLHELDDALSVSDVSLDEAVGIKVWEDEDGK